VPLEGKAKGFHITGGNPYEALMEDSQLNAFQAKLLANGVGIVKTVIKALKEIPGKQGLEQEVGQLFLEDLNPRHTVVWIWSMTLMRTATAAYAETDHFEKGGSTIALRQVPPRSCTCKSPKINGWIWKAMQRPAHGLQPYR